MRYKLLLILVLLIGIVSPASAQEKSYSAERFDVDIVIQEDGSLLVTETVTFSFIGEPFTFVFRELEGAYSDGIVNIEAFVDGERWSEGSAPGEVEITGGRDKRIEWHLPPTANTTRTFTLRYEMLGVIRQTDDADLLRYQPLADEFDYKIGSSTVTISYPASAALVEPPSADEGAEIWQEDGRIITQQTNIDDSDETTITAKFAPGSLIETAPAWQQKRQAQNGYAPFWLAGAAIVLVGGAVGLAQFIRRYGVPTSKTAVPQTEPPSALPPALAGAINGNGAEATQVNALATLFDLADRGVLLIEETADKRWYQKHAFEIHLLKRPSNLRPHELALLDLLFVHKGESSELVKLSDLSSRLTGKSWKAYQSAVRDELNALGYISQEKKAASRRVMGVGIALLVVSGVVGGLTAIFHNTFGAWPFAIGLATFVLSLFYMGLSATVKPLNSAGLVEAERWQHFYQYMMQLSRGKATPKKQDLFTAFLPYAASYGLLNRWVDWYKKEGGTDLPHYFNTISATAHDGFSAFVAMSHAASSSGAGAAGGGAAGGGASGAG